MFTSPGKWKRTKIIFSTLKNSFIGRNGVMFGIGLGMFGVCLILHFFRRRIKKHPRWKKVYHFAWLLSLFLMALSMTAGDGHGLGFGEGSGVGIGSGAGAGVGENVGVGSIEKGDPNANASGGEREIVVRVNGSRVTVDGEKVRDEQMLTDVLLQKYRDGMKVIVEGKYAENETFRWVTNTLTANGLHWKEH